VNLKCETETNLEVCEDFDIKLIPTVILTESRKRVIQKFVNNETAVEVIKKLMSEIPKFTENFAQE